MTGDPFAVLDVLDDGQALTVGSSESDGLDLDERRSLLRWFGLLDDDEQNGRD